MMLRRSLYRPQPVIQACTLNEEEAADAERFASLGERSEETIQRRFAEMRGRLPKDRIVRNLIGWLKRPCTTTAALYNCNHYNSIFWVHDRVTYNKVPRSPPAMLSTAAVG